MNKVLIINASVRDEKSYSRKLTQIFVENWKNRNPQDKFTHREVGLIQIPTIDKKWIASAFIKPQDRTKQNQSGVKFSNELVTE